MKVVLYGSALLAVAAGCFVAGRYFPRTPASHPAEDAKHVLYYVDPMHPAYKSDMPGIAPDCGMQLVAVYAGSGDGRKSSPPDGSIQVDLVQQQLIGMRTIVVEKSKGSASYRVLGKVAVDESRVYRINSGVEGWIREVSAASVGTFVHKDESLASFYSPEFIALEQGYLVSTERGAGSTKQLAAPGTLSTSTRLRNFGMGEKQIAGIAATRQMPENVDITSPGDGFVLARNTAIGQRFERGVELYRIGDLSHVWVMAEVPESEAQSFRGGMAVTVRVPGQSRKFDAHVSRVLPQFDSVSQTMLVRLEANNPGFALRPDMIVDVEAQVSAPAGLGVPLDALLDAGNEQRVYVDRGDGSFEPRKVTTGRRLGDRVEVLDGLRPGEHVVVAGNFLLDSESRLQREGAEQTSHRPIVEAQ